MQIIPAIDIIDGKCVRLTEGDYQKKTEYTSSPLEMAKIYEDNGIKRLHLVDLDGARSGQVVNWQVAEQMASHTSLCIDFGGGVKTKAEVSRILDLGIAFVTVGSVAAKQPELFEEWIAEWGADQFMLGADVREGKIMVSGWQEKSDLDVLPFLQRYRQKEIKNVFCTDVSRDGRLEGPAFDLYAILKKEFPDLFLIASGGVSSLHDLDELQKAGCDGVIIGKAIYEKRISIEQLREYIVKNGN